MTWYAVGRMLAYWLFFFGVLAAFIFAPYWLNGWPINTVQWVDCGGFALWGAAMTNLAHEILFRKANP